MQQAKPRKMLQIIIPLNYSHEASDGNGCKEGEVTSQTIHIAYWFTSHCLDKQQQEIKPFCPKIYSTVLLRSSLHCISYRLESGLFDNVNVHLHGSKVQCVYPGQVDVLVRLVTFHFHLSNRQGPTQVVC